MLYRERRSQPLWLLFLALLMTISLGIAYSAATTTALGTFIGIALSAPAIWWWRSRAVDLAVDADTLRVGRMRLERRLITEVEVLNPEQFLHRIRSGASTKDVLSFTTTNTGGVVVRFADPTDPFNAWVLSSRQPERLAASLTPHDSQAT